MPPAQLSRRPRPRLGASIAAVQGWPLLALAFAGAVIWLAAAASAAQALPAPPMDSGVWGPGWVGPYPVSAPADAERNNPQLAMDPAGNAVAAWDEWDYQAARYVIKASTRAPGGDWSEPQRVSSPYPYGDDTHPAVAAGADGEMIAIWSTGGGVGSVPWVSSRPAGGSWGPPVALDRPDPFTTEWSQVAVARNGDAVAIWHTNGDHLKGAIRPAGGSWPEDPQLIANHVPRNPRLAVGPDGEATVVWAWLASAQSSPVIWAATRRAGESRWEPPEMLTEYPGPEPGQPDVTADANGDVTVVWVGIRAPGPGVQTTTRGAHSVTWGPVEVLSTQGEDPPGPAGPCAVAVEPIVAAGPAGDLTVAWLCQMRVGGDRYSVIQARTRPADASEWSETADLFLSAKPEGTISPHLQVAVDREGNSVAVWQHCPYYTAPPECTGMATERPAGGEWTVPHGLFVKDYSFWSLPPPPALSEDGIGNAALAWVEDNSVQVAGYDGAGPQLRDLRIPESGTVGEAIDFSVSPVDVWSRIGFVMWEFGDRRGAFGRTTSHTYRRPGDYRVTVAAWDRLGIPSKQSSPIHIRPLGPADPEPRIFP